MKSKTKPVENEVKYVDYDEDQDAGVFLVNKVTIVIPLGQPKVKLKKN